MCKSQGEWEHSGKPGGEKGGPALRVGTAFAHF